MDQQSWRPPPWAIPLIIVVLLVPAAIGFLLEGPALGLALGGLSAAALVLVAARTVFREPIAPDEVKPGDPVLAVLVAPVETRSVAERVARATQEAGTREVLVLAPVEPTAAQRWLSLRGTTREDAQARIDQAVARLEEAGCSARGEIVDADPERAVEDQAAVHGAAAIVFVLPADHDLRDEIDDVIARTSRPVSEIEVPALPAQPS